MTIGHQICLLWKRSCWVMSRNDDDDKLIISKVVNWCYMFLLIVNVPKLTPSGLSVNIVGRSH